MKIEIKTKSAQYDVIIDKDILKSVDKFFNLKRKVLIITDSEIPNQYIDIVKSKCIEPYIYVIKSGEESKNYNNYISILKYLVDHEFKRSDAIVAIGGGVVTDISGFVSATYMRGIDFYSVPTTLLAQVDASVGGKTAINLNQYKNLVGCFYQPKGVLIDVNTLNTLSKRQFNSGMVEVIKMSCTSNQKLFDLIYDSMNLDDNIVEIIYQAIMIKKSIVEQDETETGIRKILNFGHTFGHAYEGISNFNLLHGEAVALGMLNVCSNEVKEKLLKQYQKLGIDIKQNFETDEIIKYIKHDKKSFDEKISLIYVEKIGSYKVLNEKIDDLKKYL